MMGKSIGLNQTELTTTYNEVNGTKYIACDVIK